jgi:copper(I)-binding protein
MKLVLPSLILIAASMNTYADDALEIEDAWIAEAPPVSKVMAAYMKIENETSEGRQATSMTCSNFERAEFHRTVEQDGMARMQHQEVLTIPAHSELKLEPGSYHIMLFTPSQRLKAGDKTECKMTFDNGTKLSIELEVKKAFEDHSHHEHHHH